MAHVPVNALQDVRWLPTLAIINACLHDQSGLHTIKFTWEGAIKSIVRQLGRLEVDDNLDAFDDAVSGITTYDADGGLVLPTLCHAHVHLDKCFLLQDPKYSDLKIVSGSFDEAMELTRHAKHRFDEADVLRRARRLIRESLESGVTIMRAFVELDEVTDTRSLDAIVKLKEECQRLCTIQICAFAQLPIFTDRTHDCGGRQGHSEPAPSDQAYSAAEEARHGCYCEGCTCRRRARNASQSGRHLSAAGVPLPRTICEQRRHMLQAAFISHTVEVIGTTPYVEANLRSMKENVTWAISKALEHRKHLDFHLDYNLNVETPPLIHFVVDELHRLKWLANAQPDKKITIGHCSRLTEFSMEEWRDLERKTHDLPICFVGLPTSDLFMMGRPVPGVAGSRPRGTLQIPQMIHDFGFEGCISINNIGNAFTPWGNCDPLAVAHLGIGVYQAGTRRDTETLYRCVSSLAKNSIGLQSPVSTSLDLSLHTGNTADLVVFDTASSYVSAPVSVSELVYSPQSARRNVFFRGARIAFDWEEFYDYKVVESGLLDKHEITPDMIATCRKNGFDDDE